MQVLVNELVFLCFFTNAKGTKIKCGGGGGGSIMEPQVAIIMTKITAIVQR